MLIMLFKCKLYYDIVKYIFMKCDMKMLFYDIFTKTILYITEPVKVLTGHEKYISSITYFAGLLISVSWDR